MSAPFLVEDPLMSNSSNVAEHALRSDERSPLVAVTIAMAVAGCLIATADAGTLLGPLWALVFLTLAVEEEVRTQEVPKWIGVIGLVARIGFVAFTADTPELLQSLAGAIVAPGLLVPLYGAGFVRSGTLIASATLGAIAGVQALPILLLIAAAIWIPFAMIRISRDPELQTLPVFAALGFAAAAYQML